jgi:hypothetical protein
MESDILKKLSIISIKNFYQINYFSRLIVNSEIEKNYLKNYNSESGGYSFLISDYKSKFFDNLYSKFLNTSFEIFGGFTLSPRNKSVCWSYKSNKKDYASVWHNHVETSTINGVYYHQIKKGDSISFLDENNKNVKYYPSMGEMLIFPNTLIHKPNIPVSGFFNSNRYSINVEIITKESSQELFKRRSTFFKNKKSYDLRRVSSKTKKFC